MYVGGKWQRLGILLFLAAGALVCTARGTFHNRIRSAAFVANVS